MPEKEEPQKNETNQSEFEKFRDLARRLIRVRAKRGTPIDADTDEGESEQLQKRPGSQR